MSEHEPPIPGMLYAHVEKFGDSYGPDGAGTITTQLDQANVITSMVADKVGTHQKLVIDLDLPAKLIPSSTPGHFHLYVDHEIEKDKYFELLEALANCGLIEEGYLGAALSRGHTAVRLPWIKKDPVSETAEETTEAIQLTEQEVG